MTLRRLTSTLLAATLLVGALGIPPALAAPEEEDAPPDAVTAALIERAFLPPAGLVQSMRDKASDLVLDAMHFLGVPYRRGGQSEAGFDCSGFTRHMFEASIGLVLPRRADEQAKSPTLTKIARDELKPGDLVFFNTLRRTFSHVGIYVGDGKFIHAPRTGSHVRIDDMRASYWSKRFTGARRAPLPQADTAPAAETLAGVPTPATNLAP